MSSIEELFWNIDGKFNDLFYKRRFFVRQTLLLNYDNDHKYRKRTTV